MEDFEFLHKKLEDENNQNLNNKLTRIFLVEDDEVLGRAILKYLSRHLEIEIYYFTGPAECLMFIDEEKSRGVEDIKFILVSDISFAEGAADGLLLIDLLKEKGFSFISIAMTGFASIETAITATKKGVFHYLTKPFELKVLSELIIKAAVNELGQAREFIEKSSMTEITKSKSGAGQPSQYKVCAAKKSETFQGMIGKSKIMQDVFERIKKVAQSESTILITGPSGTGKELVANAIHQLSPRSNREKVSVNCGAIPADLLESELFGHEKGSFTGAVSTRIGRFEMASGATIFLDEIGDMPLLLQVKLLRVLQNREIERIGNNESIPIDVRIITATHRDLEEEISRGNFREDLFYRLNVIPIVIPALCQRKEDIPLLLSYFLSRFVSADGRNNIEFEDDALELLISYNWPGNVRELENLVERLVILKGGSTISIHDLPTKFQNYLGQQNKSIGDQLMLPDEGLNLKETLASIENSYIAQALKFTEGNKNKASKLLQMNRTTLIEKMKKKGLEVNV